MKAANRLLGLMVLTERLGEMFDRELTGTCTREAGRFNWLFSST